MHCAASTVKAASVTLCIWSIVKPAPLVIVSALQPAQKSADTAMYVECTPCFATRRILSRAPGHGLARMQTRERTKQLRVMTLPRAAWFSNVAAPGSCACDMGVLGGPLSLQQGPKCGSSAHMCSRMCLDLPGALLQSWRGCSRMHARTAHCAVQRGAPPTEISRQLFNFSLQELDCFSDSQVAVSPKCCSSTATQQQAGNNTLQMFLNSAHMPTTSSHVLLVVHPVTISVGAHMVATCVLQECSLLTAAD